jgi:1,2-phenylacetyl-CoA epoxidase catalytic subunit
VRLNNPPTNGQSDAGTLLFGGEESLDCRWHRQWSESLVRMAIEDNARNRDTIQGWINQWYPLAARAVHTFASLLEDTLEEMKTPPPERRERTIDRHYRDYLRSMNLEVGP